MRPAACGLEIRGICRSGLLNTTSHYAQRTNTTSMAETFPFKSPRQLLEKAGRDIARLNRAVGPVLGGPDETQIADLTMDVAWTLWHVTDWIAGNTSDEKCARIVASKHVTVANSRERLWRFQKALRRESPDLRRCWELATQFKHFRLEARSRRRMHMERVYGSTGAADVLINPPSTELPDTAFTSGAIVVSAVGTRPSPRTLHPKIIEGSQRLRLTEVYGRAYRYLDRLLRQHGL